MCILPYVLSQRLNIQSKKGWTKATTLPSSSEELKTVCQVPIYFNSSQWPVVQGLYALDEDTVKAHSFQDHKEKYSIDSVKSFFSI